MAAPIAWWQIGAAGVTHAALWAVADLVHQVAARLGLEVRSVAEQTGCPVEG